MKENIKKDKQKKLYKNIQDKAFSFELVDITTEKIVTRLNSFLTKEQVETNFKIANEILHR